MIISNKQVQKVINAYLQRTGGLQDNHPASVREKREGTSPDQVSLSVQAKEVEKLKKEILAVPEVREEKVQELAKRISAGEYKVNAQDVAEKMLARDLADRLS